MLYNSAGTGPMRCSVVGMISADHIYLDNHGDFNADDTYATFSEFRDASYSFSLRSPGSSHPDFDRDFDRAVANIRDICHFLPDDEVIEEPFISSIESGGVSLNFDRKVFQHFVSLILNVALLQYVDADRKARFYSSAVRLRWW